MNNTVIRTQAKQESRRTTRLTKEPGTNISKNYSTIKYRFAERNSDEKLSIMEEEIQAEIYVIKEGKALVWQWKNKLPLKTFLQYLQTIFILQVLLQRSIEMNEHSPAW